MKRRLLASVLTLVMVLSLLPTVAWAREGDGDEPSASTTLRMKVGETRTVSFDSGMEEYTDANVSTSGDSNVADVSIESVLTDTTETGEPVTGSTVPEGYYYIRGTRKNDLPPYWSDQFVTQSWSNDPEKLDNSQWLKFADKDAAVIYQVIANGDGTYALQVASEGSEHKGEYLSSSYGELTEAVIKNYANKEGNDVSFNVASMDFSKDSKDSKFTITPASASTTTGHYELSASNGVYVNSLGGQDWVLFYQTSSNNEGSIMDFYKVGYTTTVTVTARSVGEDTITVGDQTIKIIVSEEETFKDVYVGVGQSTEVPVKSASKYNDDVLCDTDDLKVIAASSEITTGTAVDPSSFTEGVYVIRDQRSNQFATPENRYYTDEIAHKNDFAGREVITESSLNNAGLYEFIANGDGTYAVKTGDKYLKTTGITMDNNGASGLISSVSWTNDRSESKVQLVEGPDGTVGLYTQTADGNHAMMASWGGYQFSMWANYSSPSVSSGSALLLYPASVTTTLNVSAQTAGDYEVVFEDTVLRIHVVDAVRVPVMGSVTVDCDGVTAGDKVEIPENLQAYITCDVIDDTVTFENNDATGLTVGKIFTGTVMVGKAAFSVSIGIDEAIDMAQGGTKEIAYKDGAPVASNGLSVATKTENKAVLVTDVADIQDGGEYLIAGMRVQTVAGSEEIDWNPGSRDVHGLKKLAGTTIVDNTESFTLTDAYDAARVRFDKVGENTYTLYNISAGKYLTGSSFNLALTARKSEASAMTVTARSTTSYGAGLVSIGTGSYEIGDWGGYWSNGFTMIPTNNNGTELKLFAAVDSIATITANASGYVTVGGKTYQVNVFKPENAAAELNGALYPTVTAAVKDAKAGDTISLKNTNDIPEETVEILVGVTVKYSKGRTFSDAYYQVKVDDNDIEIPVQSENGKAILFLPSSAPEVIELTADDLNLGGAKLSIADGQATATVEEGAVTLTKTFTVAKAGNISAIFVSGLKEENDTSKNADINWINTSKSNVGVEGKLVKVAADGTLSVNSDIKKMKGRGNTSWGAAVDGNAATDKKPYNITLKGDEGDTLIDGLGYKAKKWCLIANNYADFSGVNNYMAYTMYQEIDGNSAMHVEPVDLYVDGEYRGIYLVTDKVEIGENRVNVPESEYSTAKGTAESQAKVIVENYDSKFDTDADVKYWQYAKSGATVTAAADDAALNVGVLAYAYAAEQTQDELNGGYVLEVSHQYTDEAGWFITNHGVMISFKEPERPTQAQVQAAAIYVQEFEDALYSETGYNSLGKHYSEYLDIESFAKTYLLSCFTGQNDFLDCSDYLNLEPTYADGKITGGKLMGGPAWDYDVSNYATDRLYADKSSTNVNGNQAWISQLLKHGDFTDALYKLKTGAFADAVESMKTKVEDYGKNVAASLAMDQLMWNRTTSAQQQYNTQKANFLKRANTTWDKVWNDDALKGVSVAENKETGEIVATANTTGDVTYQWYKLNEDKTTATECAGATKATYTPSEAGTYFVAVTGTAKMNGKDVPETMFSAAVKSEGHRYSNTWKSDADNHWHACEVDGHTDKRDLAEHSWDDGVVKTEATCTEAGVKTYTCSVCKATKTETIPAKDHDYADHTYTWNKVENGYTCTAERVCRNDASHKETETVTASYAVTTEPTCTDEGEGIYTASFENNAFSQQTKTVTISATSHDWSNKDGICAVCHTKCTEMHKPGTTCKVCGKYTRRPSTANPGNTISVPSTPNGTVTVNPSTASKGETVTITTKPSEGYELGDPTVKDANGNTLPLTDKGDGKYTFTMPDSKVSIEASFVKAASTSFADVPANAYFADAVEWAVGKEITNGLSATTFGPYESCTRAQIVTFLWRAAGSPEPKAMSSFTDVPATSYYAKAVAWAVENGITNGMTETTFAPNATCTRGQSVTFLYRALGKKVESSANFTDVKSDAFYADAVDWAVANNVTNGTSATTFSPNADCTRAEIVTFLYRAYQGK